jgi:D-glycero-D-manno-heptose 1,7-bisphosphate phosphatase
MSDVSAYFFDLGGTLVALDGDEIACDKRGRITLLANVATRLKEVAGRPVFVITNQAGVALGTLTEAQARGFVEQVNAQTEGVVRDYRACMHHPNAGCGCRKPQPGMLLDLAAAHHVDLSAAMMVGDTAGDERCARAAGVGTFVWADEFFGRKPTPRRP